ncbi:MAG TPA: SusC/RagA family TonB-linked outer membrane protein, partial [Chitinophaga sp.]
MFTQRLLKVVLATLLFGWLTPGAYAQQVSLTGKVTDEKGQPLPGAGIQVRGSRTGASADNAGVFHLNVPPNATIIVSYVGYNSDTIPLSGQTVLNVTLRPSTAALDAVVVVGYGTQRRRDVTGSIASVKGADVKNQPVTNVTEAIQGRMAGVEIIKSSGAPDAPSSILIRGVSSLNNAQPLYIVDGVRQANGENFNMADIADINVLKDASAAAIYGSAAAGGVIIITTKRGQVGKPVVNLSARYGVTTPRSLKLLHRDDWIKMKRLIDPTYLQGNDHTDTLPDTDWTKELFRNGNEQNYNLSVSGATNTANYLVSGLYNDQKGVYLNNTSRLIGARINSDFKLGNYVKVGEEVYVWGRNTAPVPPYATPINPPFRTTPIMPVYNPDKSDKSNIWGQSPTGYSGPNLVGQIETAHISNKKLNLQGNAFAEVKLPVYLTFRTTLGYTYYNEQQNYFQEPYNFGQVKSPSNRLEKYTNNNQTLLVNYTLSFDHTFGKHAINALAGYEQIQNKFDGIDASETNVGGTSFGFIQTSQSSAFVTGGYDPNGLVKSQFGRLNYNYGGKYYVSGAIRRDANFTVFGPGNQHGTFPSASAGWHISDEPFFKKAVPQIDLLKLRGSWGRLGNSNINSYYFLTTYNQVNSVNFAPGGAPSVGITQTFIPNKDIKWEQVEETNIGLDLEALQHRINFTVEWYNKTTNDMLYGLPVALSSGITALYETNIG